MPSLRLLKSTPSESVIHLPDGRGHLFPFLSASLLRPPPLRGVRVGRKVTGDGPRNSSSPPLALHSLIEPTHLQQHCRAPHWGRRAEQDKGSPWPPAAHRSVGDSWTQCARGLIGRQGCYLRVPHPPSEGRLPRGSLPWHRAGRAACLPLRPPDRPRGVLLGRRGPVQAGARAPDTDVRRARHAPDPKHVSKRGKLSFYKLTGF